MTRRRNSCEHQPQAGSLQANTSGLRGKGLSVPGGACLVDYDEPSGPYERRFDRTSHLHPCLHRVHGKHDAMLGNAGQRPRHGVSAAHEQCEGQLLTCAARAIQRGQGRKTSVWPHALPKRKPAFLPTLDLVIVRHAQRVSSDAGLVPAEAHGAAGGGAARVRAPVVPTASRSHAARL